MTDAQPKHGEGTWPCPRCRSSRSDVEAVCRNCKWDPNDVATDATAAGRTPSLPQRVVVVRSALILLVVIVVALNLFPKNATSQIANGWPGSTDPNWVLSHKTLGFPATWLSLTHSSNQVLQITTSGWMIHPFGLVIDALLLLLIMTSYHVIGVAAARLRSTVERP